jgi:hypothetical protein
MIHNCDRPVLENWVKSLRTAYGDAVAAEVSAGLLRLTIGGKTIWLTADGRLEGESGVRGGSL